MPDSGTAVRWDTLALRNGFGFTRRGEQARQNVALRSVFAGIPKVRVVGSVTPSFSLLLTTPAGGTCTPTLYIDGERSTVEELHAFRPAHVARVDVYARPSTAPFRLPDLSGNCGVIAVWTTTRP